MYLWMEMILIILLVILNIGLKFKYDRELDNKYMLLDVLRELSIKNKHKTLFERME